MFMGKMSSRSYAVASIVPSSRQGRGNGEQPCPFGPLEICVDDYDFRGTLEECVDRCNSRKGHRSTKRITVRRAKSSLVNSHLRLSGVHARFAFVRLHLADEAARPTICTMVSDHVSFNDFQAAGTVFIFEL